ncbi:hypothetical protein, partial [Neisseria bacilliformis]|uniref:hypothetical protein n=1 Tax=Neisseria bacilliformis TaxID=267212 RepID=UPI0028EE2466
RPSEKRFSDGLCRSGRVRGLRHARGFWGGVCVGVIKTKNHLENVRKPPSLCVFHVSKTPIRVL